MHSIQRNSFKSISFNLLIINNLQHIYQDIQVFILIMSVLIAIILLLYIYRIFILASIWLFSMKWGRWVFVFLHIVFLLCFSKVRICGNFGFSFLQGILWGCPYLFFFGRGSAKAAFYPLPRGNRCTQYIKMTICKTNQNNSYQNDMAKMKIFKLRSL